MCEATVIGYARAGAEVAEHRIGDVGIGRATATGAFSPGREAVPELTAWSPTRDSNRSKTGADNRPLG